MVTTSAQLATFMKENDKAIQNIDKRLVDLKALKPEIEKREKWELRPSDSARLKKIKKEEEDAVSALTHERELRSNTDTAIKNSTFPAKAKYVDPTVQKALSDLAAHKKAVGTSLYSGGTLLNGPCVKCAAKLNKIKDCNKPAWQKITIKKKLYEGPMYPVCHTEGVGDSDAWDGLIGDGTKTPSEKNVITQVSGAEGDLATVQAWDDQIASLGAMQKTVKPDGTGELTQQIADFKAENPEKYDELFVKKGWSVEPVNVNAGTSKKPNYVNKAFFTPQDTPDAKPMTGKELRDYIKAPGNEGRWRETLGPLKAAGEDETFQHQQIIDYNNRLVSALGKTPSGYKHWIGSYITSEKGSALVLDEDINRPGHTAGDFKKALDGFYKDHPNASKDPATWGTSRSEFEKDIISRYSSNREMVDSAKRAKGIMGSSLGSDPGSMKFPGVHLPAARTPDEKTPAPLTFLT